MHSSRRSLALVRLRRSLPPSVCSLYSSIVLLVGSLFHHADFTFLHQGNSHLFAPLCHFLHAVVLSLFPPCCVLLSFGVLISRLSSEFWSLFALIWVRDGMLFSSLQNKFVIFFSQFVITFYHHRVFSFFFFSLYKLTQPISNGSVGFFSPPPSPSVYQKAPGWRCFWTKTF